ncbi:MAG TPA: RNA polymerase sigma factor [Thermoanaerobaculia bacterium]|nr:RNA polymerase sigma factor [Thermoanaerobaculia bacterium]
MTKLRAIDLEEERTLLQALRESDDPEVFRQVFHRYYRRLLQFFQRRGLGLESARDLSQDALFRVYRSRREIRTDLPLGAWIFTVATNVYRNEVRRRQTEKRSGKEESLHDERIRWRAESHGVDPGAVAEPLTQTLDGETVDALWQQVDELPPQMRQVFLMRYRQNREIRDIARLLGVAESTVKVQIHQARSRLRDALNRRFGDFPW